MNKALYIFILFSSTLSSLPGQFLKLEIKSEKKASFEYLDRYNRQFRDSAELSLRIQSIKTALFERGYLLSESQWHYSPDTSKLLILPGNQLYVGELKLVPPPELAIPLSPQFRSTTLNKNYIVDFSEYYLRYLENNGYPFANLKFSKTNLNNDSLSGEILVDPGPLQTLDSIAIKGFDRFSSNVLKYDLEFRKGMLYSEAYIRKLPELINRIEYLSVSNKPAIAFSRDQNILFLYLEEVKSNQIDGVLGLNTDESGEITLNGDIQLRLLHVFKKGEEINLQWRRPDQSIQSLNFRTEIPYLINTPIWTELQLGIFRQDSSFVNTDVEAWLKFLIESGSFINGGMSYKSSNVLIDNSSTGTFGSFKTTSYKLGIELRKTNRPLVPTSGYRTKIYGIRGQRKTAESSLGQYGWYAGFENWLPLFGDRHIIKSSLKSEALFGAQLFTNELYRVGGLKTLRGFNEQSIYTSFYGIGSLEYHYMIGKYDYLALFTDIAYAENRSGGFSSNWFTGLGGGVNFQTAGGIFSLFYAIGKDSNNPFDLRTSKIHFGYVNTF